MVDAQHCKAVEWHVLHELVEAGEHGLPGAPVVEMLGVHVGHHGNRGWEPEKAAVALVGLDHHPLAGAHAGVGAVVVDDAAVDDRRVEPGGLQHGGDEAGGRRLAMGAADGDRPAQPHEFGQHLRPAYHRDQPGARRLDFGVVGLHRGRDHDHLAIAEVARIMADRDGNAGLAQPPHIGTIGDIAALHGIAEIVQHLGNAGHADAADADEMDGADRERQRPHALLS